MSTDKQDATSEQPAAVATRLDRGVRPPALDFAGNEVLQNCENCDGLYDDSDGIEYGPPCPCCDIKPHMQYLKGFPFKTPQKCFQIAWWHLVDWDAEGRKLDEESRQSGQAA